MLWTLNLKPNRKYTQTTEKSFHVSHAAIDGEPGCTNKIFLIVDNEKFLLCTLKANAVDQVRLNLNFAKGEDIGFQSVGNGNVTLSGYIRVQPSFAKKNNEKKRKKNERINKEQQQSQQKSGKCTIAGGVKVEDIKLENGPEAIPGKRISIHYVERLKKIGAPFEFGLGKGEVIEDYELAISGMKIGGKCRVSGPSHVTVLEIELKDVN